MPDTQLCGMDRCKELRVTTFADENLCCDHFVARCYEFLEHLDPERRLASDGQESDGELKRVIEECSRRVLEISLGTPQLNNLQRARLLDILLWASEIAAGNRSKVQGPNGPFKPKRTGTTETQREAQRQRAPKGTRWRTSLLY